jgi:hypothetical protein
MNNALPVSLQFPWVWGVILIWSLFWKGLALWQAAGRKQISWFVILLAVNTVGLLEIAYILWLNRWDLGSQKILTRLEKISLKK